MSEVVLRCCGSISVIGPDGVDHPITGSRGSLVALLAVRVNSAMSAEALVDAMWNGNPPSTARSSLRNFVTRTRRHLEELGIVGVELVTVESSYVLEADPDRIDLHVLERLAAEGRSLEHAGRFSELVTRYQATEGLIAGEPFAGLDLDCLVPTRVRAASLIHEVLGRRARAEYHAGDLAVAEAMMRDQLIDDPCDEAAAELLMRSLYRQGRPSEALAVCNEAGQCLAERGLELSPAIRELEALVLRHDAGLRPGPTVRAGSKSGQMIGREHEWDLARRVIIDGIGPLVILGGPGAGKSRLIDEIRSHWQQSGVPVASLECPRDCLPFEPWKALLADLGVADDLFVRHADPISAFSTVLHEIEQRAREHRVRYLRPLLVIIDDGHWLDRDSVALLARLVPMLDTIGVTLVLGSRSSTTDLRADFAGVLSDLLRRPTTTKIELGPLDPSDAHRLVSALADERRLVLDDETIVRICSRAAGIPLYLTELATMDTGPTATLRVSVLDRLRGLGPESETVLRAIAVLGRVLDPAHLSAAAELSPAAVGRCLVAAQRAGLIRVDPESGVIEFVHDLITEIIASDVTDLDRARVHRLMVDALDDEQVVSFGVPYLEGAVPLLAPERAAWLLTLAARHALRGSALAAAARLGRRGLSVAEDRCPHRIDLLVDALIVAGEAVMASDESVGRELLTRAADLAFSLGDPARLIDAVDTRRGRNFVIDPVTIQRLQEALHWVPSDQVLIRSRIEAELALMTIEVVPGASAVEHGKAAADLADGCRDSTVEVGALHARILSSRTDLDPVERLSLGERLRSVGIAARDDRAVLLGDMLSLIDRLELGEASSVVDDARRHEAEAERIGWWRYRFYSAVIEATALEAIGEARQFAATSERAVAIGNEGALADAAMIGSAQRVVALIHQGNLSLALPQIEPVVARYGGLPVWNCVHAAALAHAGRAGDADAVLRGLHATDRDPFPRGLMYWTCHSLVALCALWGTLPRWGSQAADVLAAASGRFVVPGFGLGVLGPIDVFLAAAAMAAGREADADHWLDRAERQITETGQIGLAPLVTSVRDTRGSA